MAESSPYALYHLSIVQGIGIFGYPWISVCAGLHDRQPRWFRWLLAANDTFLESEQLQRRGARRSHCLRLSDHGWWRRSFIHLDPDLADSSVANCGRRVWFGRVDCERKWHGVLGRLRAQLADLWLDSPSGLDRRHRLNARRRGLLVGVLEGWRLHLRRCRVRWIDGCLTSQRLPGRRNGAHE